MRKIKSAPANLCLLKNNKNKKSKNIIASSNDKNNILPIVSPENINSETNFITKKFVITNINEFANDMIQSSKLLDNEEINIISIVINYIFENIVKKKNLEELKNYIASYFVKYFIIFLFHNYVLHDANEKYIHTVDIIHSIFL